VRKFWLGVLAGSLVTLFVCGLLPITLRSFGPPRAFAGLEQFGLPPPPIVLRGLFGSRGEMGVVDEVGDRLFKFTSRDGKQGTVIVTDDTLIFQGSTKITIAELSRGERLLVIGIMQADGTIKAKLIRLVSSDHRNRDRSDRTNDE
jgi:hypothetical protein